VKLLRTLLLFNQSINQSVSLLKVIDKRSDGTWKNNVNTEKMSINLSVQHVDEKIISQEAEFSLSFLFI